jgi:protein SCO1/2
MIRRGYRAVGILLGALLVAAAAASFVLPAFREPVESAPNFTLTDQDGQTFTLSAQRGHPFVLFFGYAHCADACPLTVAHVGAALRSERLESTVRLLFVTVDPQRDTPSALRRYVRLFDPSPIGLTGSRAQLDPVYSAYHVLAQQQVGKRGSSDYSIAHGTTLYFIDAAGRLRGLADWDESPVGLAHDFKAYLS